jgi:hypothetical protein
LTVYVLSVPHTGSRTLLEHLGVRWEDAASDGRLLHFGYDDVRIMALGDAHVQIPIRDPIQTLASWYSRRLSLDRCLRCMSTLAVYDNPNATFTLVSTLPGRVRTGRERVRGAVARAREHWDSAPQAIKDFYLGKIPTGSVGEP